MGIDSNGWETLASERSAWRQEVKQGLPEFEGILAEQAETKRQTRDRPGILTTSAHCAEGTVMVFPASQDLFENHQFERDTIVVFENEGCR